jgi:hypothetical protein
MRNLPLTLALFSLSLLPAPAALLVYESFNYTGTVGNNTTIGGTATTATGLSGNWAVANTGTASTVYSTAGLSFGSNFSVNATSGAIIQSGTTGGGNAGVSIAGADLAAGNVTGTIYGSYLVRFSAFSSHEGAITSQRLSTGHTTGGTSTYFLANAETSGLGAPQRPSVGYGNTAVDAGSGFTAALDTTYLIVTRFTNVGTALSGGSPGVATLWIFDLAAYDEWVTEGNASEDNLTGDALKTVTATATSSTFNFGETGVFAQFGTSSGQFGTTQTAKFDELRYGTSLADVTTVPEPGAAALLLPLAVWISRRRR